MISLSLIPKIIFKPRSAFEELKDNATASEGVLMLIIVSMLSLILYGIVSRITGGNFMAFQFGFGPVLTIGNVFLFFSLQFFGILIISYISNLISGKLGGSGNLPENFAFVCYSYSFNIVPAIGSAIALLWLKAQINAAMAAINAGTIGTANYIAALSAYSSYGILIFGIWLIYILTEAVSVSHNISRLKGFAAVIAGYLIVAAVIFSILKFASQIFVAL